MSAPRFRQHADGRVAIRMPGSLHWFVCTNLTGEQGWYWARLDADVSGEGWSELFVVDRDLLQTASEACSYAHMVAGSEDTAHAHRRLRTLLGRAGDPR